MEENKRNSQEKRGTGKQREKWFEYYESDSNHSNHSTLWLLLLNGEKRGGP